MATKNPRINVTFEESVVNVLSHLASHEHKSLSSIVRELALEALDLREDFYLSKIAKKIDQADAKTFSHEEAWK